MPLESVRNQSRNLAGFNVINALSNLSGYSRSRGGQSLTPALLTYPFSLINISTFLSWLLIPDPGLYSIIIICADPDSVLR